MFLIYVFCNFLCRCWVPHTSNAMKTSGRFSSSCLILSASLWVSLHYTDRRTLIINVYRYFNYTKTKTFIGLWDSGRLFYPECCIYMNMFSCQCHFLCTICFQTIFWPLTLISSQTIPVPYSATSFCRGASTCQRIGFVSTAISSDGKPRWGS